MGNVLAETKNQQQRLDHSNLTIDEKMEVSTAMITLTALSPNTKLWVVRFMVEDLTSDHEELLQR